MARQEIILGTPPTGLGGDTPRVASSKINAMTLELYQGIGTPAAPLPVANGGTGVTSLPTPFIAIRDGSALSQTGGQSERKRMQTYNPWQLLSDIDDVSASQIVGPGYVGPATAGTKPPGWSYGMVETHIVANDHVQQIFTGLTGTPGLSYPSFRRSGYGTGSTRWGVWLLIIDQATALYDPVSGGMMSTTVVNGYTVTKYASGLMNIMGPAPTTGTIAAGTLGTHNVTLPAGFISTNFAVPSVSIGATSSNDHYGLGTIYMTSSTNLLMIIRNGATAQTFEIKISVWGRWR